VIGQESKNIKMSASKIKYVECKKLYDNPGFKGSPNNLTLSEKNQRMT
jgi:hypothetical protein